MSQENDIAVAEQTQGSERKDRLPRALCAFAAFFTIALPAFAIAIGAGTHIAWNELAVQTALYGGTEANPFAVKLLDNHQAILWIIFAISAILCVYVFSFVRKNHTPGTLAGAGRIIIAICISATLSLFYLGVLTISVFVLIAPLLAR